MQPMRFRSVVLPPPEGPRSSTNSPLRIGYTSLDTCTRRSRRCSLTGKRQEGGPEAVGRRECRHLHGDAAERRNLLISARQCVHLGYGVKLNRRRSELLACGATDCSEVHAPLARTFRVTTCEARGRYGRHTCEAHVKREDVMKGPRAGLESGTWAGSDSSTTSSPAVRLTSTISISRCIGRGEEDPPPSSFLVSPSPANR